MLQVLDEQGRFTGDDPGYDDNLLIGLFRSMVIAREFDERVLHLQRTGRVPAYYQCSGQEASAAVGYALERQDWVVSFGREQPLRLARGVTIEEELAVFFNAVDSLWDPVERRITPISSTIGSQIPHATGVAYGERLLGNDVASLVVFGDGATSEGDFHAGMNYAGVWNTPTIFYCQNNQYAQSTPIALQTAAETLAQKAVAYGFEGIRVDGMDALAVYTAVRSAVEKAHAGDGPTLVEALMYRFAPHSTYDGEPVYRTREEEAEWKEKDPLIRMRTLVQDRELFSASDEDDLKAQTAAEVEAAITKFEAMGLPDRDVPFRHVYGKVPEHLARELGEDERVAGEPSTDLPHAVVSDEVAPAGETTKMTMVDALNAALRHAMETDPTVVVLGEDVGIEGGIFRVTAGLHDAFGADRVIDTPLCEVGIIGTSVGMAIAGLRPVPELEFAGLGYTAFDQIVFHAARYRWRTRSAINMPMVIRVPGGGGHEGYEGHSDNPEAIFVHTPGLNVVYPSNPYDAKGLMAAALQAEDPVVFFEPIVQYFVKQDGVPVEHYTVPIGNARIAREGTDATVVAYGNAVNIALAAAEGLEREGVSIEIIDLRTLKPWDRKAVLASVEKTGRLIVAHEATVYGGFGGEITAVVAEQAVEYLEAPPVRIGHPDMVWGQARIEAYSKLTPEEVADAVRRTLEN